MELNIHLAGPKDIPGILRLYAYMSDEPVFQDEEKAQTVLDEILAQKNQHLLVGSLGSQVVSSLTVTVLQSLAHGCLPYAVIKHVVTDPAFGGRGYATALMQAAAQIAKGAGCYKCMLVTSRSAKHVHSLYQKAGYRSEGYTAYTMKLL